MRIGIDLGGSKTEIIALDAAGRELLRERRPTPRDDYTATLETIAALCARVEQKLGGEVGKSRSTAARLRNGPALRGRHSTGEAGGTALTAVGIGIPGSESPRDGLIRNANSTWLNGRPLRADLEARLGRPVRLANDANCFALSEAVDGAAAGAPIVFGVILGTGVGGGVVIDGKPLLGANAIAGEWGHSPLPGADAGRACWCGRRDCIEAYLSGPALLGEYRAAGADAADVALLAQRAAAGEALAAGVLDTYATRLARALAGVINLLDPHCIVLGGGLSNLAPLYQQVPARWAPWVFSNVVETRLVAARHGDSSGVRGAAWLWPEVQ